MNYTHLIGNIVRDITTHTSDNGTVVLNNAIAVAREGKDKVTDFFDFTIFGKSAEFVSKYAEKGSKIAISGRIQTNEFTRKDGTKGKGFVVIADKVEILSKFKETETETEELTATVDDALPF